MTGTTGSTASISGTDTTGTTTTAPVTSTTVSTETHTVVGTTPSGETVTQTSTHVSTAPVGPNGIALEAGAPLAETNTTVTGQTIDGIQCDRLNQQAYELAAHLLVYVDGQPRSIPGAIGMVTPRSAVISGLATGTTTTYSQGLCAYWLRTRAANGVLEIDSPVPAHFTLGELFAIWDEPLSGDDVAGARGRVTAVINGRRWHGSPGDIPLREHEAIQLAVGAPVPAFQRVDWSDSDL